ncbi:recombinase family protein [Saccharopolyspora shandongensis]|uniref:recombinase family protein n=1 Tax=Saccharopolyspora shandongensis TaxID=418495 RepID=UPI0033D5234C
MDFIVLEQGIDTTTPGGRLVFHFLAAMAEHDRELIRRAGSPSGAGSPDCRTS